MANVDSDGRCLTCGTPVTSGGCSLCNYSLIVGGQSICRPISTETPIVSPPVHTVLPKSLPNYTIGVDWGMEKTTGIDLPPIDVDTIQAAMKDLEAAADRCVAGVVADLNRILQKDSKVVDELYARFVPCDTWFHLLKRPVASEYRGEYAVTGLALLNMILVGQGRSIVALSSYKCGDCGAEYESKWDGVAGTLCTECGSDKTERRKILIFLMEYTVR